MYLLLVYTIKHPKNNDHYMHYYRIISVCIEPHVLQQLNPHDYCAIYVQSDFIHG